MPNFRSLEVNEDIKFEQRFWKLERIAWIFMGAIALCALAGLLGPGPLSKQKRSDPTTTLTAEYNRYERYQAPTELRVLIATNAVENGKVEFSLSRSFVEAVQIERIEPEPETVELESDRYTYVFEAPELEQAAVVTFHYEGAQFWKVPGEMSVADQVKLNFEQFFYP